MVAVAINDFSVEYNEILLETNERYLSKISLMLDQLKAGQWQEEIAKEIYKLNHIMKNNFKSIGLTKLSYASHRFEDLIIKLKNKQIICNQTIYEACMEYCFRMSEAIEMLKIVFEYEMDIATDLKSHFKKCVLS